MQEPKSELQEYLNTLIFRFLHIKSLHKQIKLIYSWDRANRRSALEAGAFFYELVIYSFSRTIVLELCKLTSEREEKSLIDWLNKADEHGERLEPSRYNPETSDREILEVKEYRLLIQDKIQKLSEQESIIEILKGRRDKDIAHSDSSFFNNPTKLTSIFPLNEIDIENLMSIIEDILREQHILIFHSDLTMDIKSLHNVDTVLISTRAFNRIWKDRNLTRELKVNVGKYKLDDYDGRE